MSMLAERRQKTRYILNPKKGEWSEDSKNLGRKLMQQMGWSDGKGLGKTEQGELDPIKLKYKNDNKGMGYSGLAVCPAKQQDDFAQLLAELNQNTDENKEDSPAISKSLEEQSKSSRSRVHYQKFTRGKDLSRYSLKDLACIVGNSKSKKDTEEVEEEKIEVKELEENDDDNNEPSVQFGIPIVKGGLIGDYFKMKMEEKLKNLNKNRNNNETLQEEKKNESDEIQPIKKKKKKRKDFIIEEENTNNDDITPVTHEESSTDNNQVRKSKKKKKRVKIEEEITPSEHTINNETQCKNLNDEKVRRKKDKKKRKVIDNEIDINSKIKNKKKKRKAVKEESLSEKKKRRKMDCEEKSNSSDEYVQVTLIDNTKIYDEKCANINLWDRDGTINHKK